MKYLTTLFLAIILITPSLDISKLSTKDYLSVKSILKSTIANRTIKKPTYVEVQKWIEIVLKEFQNGCKMYNVTGKNIINILNSCL